MSGRGQRAKEADDADKAEADEADEANTPTDEVEANEANKADVADKPAKADEAEADEAANEADAKADEADAKVDEADEVIAVNEAILDDAANEAIVSDEANEASFAKANESLANGIAIVLYSLTRYCEVFAKDEGYFGMKISNNQLVGMVWSCLRSLKCQNLQRADIEDGKLLSSSMRVRLCFVLSLTHNVMQQ